MEDSDVETFCEPGSSSAVSVKRVMVDSKQAEESVARNKESDQEYSVFAKAFETDLVREGIFKCLSTSELLSTCSLVSKNWNNMACSFIYTHRQCTPTNNGEVSVCQFLENINQLCRQMVAHGRTIPFNRLKLFSYKKCPQDLNEQKSGAKLETVLVLKHLQAFIDWNDSECTFHKPLCTLLSKSRRSELRSLTVGNFLLLGKILSQSGMEYPFTKLRELTIMRDRYIPEKDIPVVKDAVAKLLKLATNLAGIFALNSQALELIPEERYGLLKRLDFQLNKTEDMDILRKIAVQSCQVEQLFVHEPPAYSESPDGEFEEEFDVNHRHQFENAAHQLLQSCRNSLRSISINGGYSLAQLSHTPLVRLVKLKMEKLYHATIEEFWHAISSVDYARVAPNLQEIEITMCTLTWSEEEMYAPGYEAEMYAPGYEAEMQWPEKSDNTVIHGCSSVRKFKLEALVSTINMPLLKDFLPNVSELELRVSYTARIESEGDLPDISEIFQLWPGLKQLTITGEQHCLKRSYDADFCGIHAEEAELLMEMDEDDLQAVQIVPIRPCLYTMTDLHKLRIDLTFSWTEDIGDSGVSVAFITKVTEIIALKRMNNKDCCISWGLE